MSNSRVSHGLLTELSSVFLSHSVSTRSLMRSNAARAFVRGMMMSSFSFGEL